MNYLPLTSWILGVRHNGSTYNLNYGSAKERSLDLNTCVINELDGAKIMFVVTMKPLPSIRVWNFGQQTSSPQSLAADHYSITAKEHLGLNLM